MLASEGVMAPLPIMRFACTKAFRWSEFRSSRPERRDERSPVTND
jgi:hypothetical protein